MPRKYKYQNPMAFREVESASLVRVTIETPSTGTSRVSLDWEFYDATGRKVGIRDDVVQVQQWEFFLDSLNSLPGDDFFEKAILHFGPSVGIPPGGAVVSGLAGGRS